MQRVRENGEKTLAANCAVDVALAVRSEWASPVEVCPSHYSCRPNSLRVDRGELALAVGQPSNYCLLRLKQCTLLVDPKSIGMTG